MYFFYRIIISRSIREYRSILALLLFYRTVEYKYIPPPPPRGNLLNNQVGQLIEFVHSTFGLSFRKLSIILIIKEERFCSENGPIFT